MSSYPLRDAVSRFLALVENEIAEEMQHAFKVRHDRFPDLKPSEATMQTIKDAAHQLLIDAEVV